jgi:hypothetical protein
MSRLDDLCCPSSCDYWVVSKAAGKLSNQACTLSARHIKDGTLRNQFNREVSFYVRSIVNEVAQGDKTSAQALKEIKSEQNSLLSQSLDIAQRGVGAVAGALQFAAGAGICYGSAGALCLFAGIPLMAHGANNVYENGRNLLEGRSDARGPVRKGYQKVAEMAGRREIEANMAYGAFDLGLSAFGVGRLVLKPDSWRLFRYVRADYVRGYEAASKGALSFEVLSNGVTINSLHEESKRKGE